MSFSAEIQHALKMEASRLEIAEKWAAIHPRLKCWMEGLCEASLSCTSFGKENDMKLTVFDGSGKPKTAVGPHQCRLLQFATEYPGWHSFRQDRTTRRAVEGLKRRGSIVVEGDQFRKA